MLANYEQVHKARKQIQAAIGDLQAAGLVHEAERAIVDLDRIDARLARAILDSSEQAEGRYLENLNK